MAQNDQYPHLFSPIKIGRLSLNNRMVIPALTTNFAEENGYVGERLINYLNARARGGWGLVTTENIGVHPTGRVMPKMIMGHDDSFIPGLKKLAENVHQNGGILIGQISHAGRQTKEKISGMPLAAPSAIPCPLNREVPQALSVNEIKKMEQRYINTACRLSIAGFDGIEIHGAHGYLVAEFLSSYANKRDDEYGGSLENRMRFLLNIIDGIQARLGKDFPLIVRISACEFVEAGLDIKESCLIAQALEKSGIHALSISVGVYESFNKLSMITGEPEGQWIPLAGQIKATVSLPIIGVGRIKRPEVAERALASGLIDLAAFGRASMADPELPNKIKVGKMDEIIHCLSCNVCLGRTAAPESTCPVNPAIGDEAAFHFSKASATKKIGIIGQALSALTTAWIAAEKGHEVTIFGPNENMQTRHAHIPSQIEYAEILSAAKNRAKRSGVQFQDEIKTDEMDQVFAVRNYAPIDLNSIITETPKISSYDLLKNQTAVLEAKKIIAIGFDLSTADAAFLATHYKNAQNPYSPKNRIVELYSPKKGIATDAHPGYREVIQNLLNNAAVKIHLSAQPDEATLASADLIIIGQNDRPENTPEWDYPKDCSPDVWLDDAYEAGRMTTAVYQAVELANTI